MAGTKFYGSTSTFLLSVAAFISLSDYAIATDARQCYWCGPLAEQVHRSRRAPPCDAPKAHVTECDPGFLHCAIVATAPPYTESRYCVKIYQDECYLDFCNTTKTWKMTCPCKGDLCNGQNSDREDKAFAELLEKTQKPNKKRSKKNVNEDPMASTNTATDNNSQNFSAIKIGHDESYTNDFVTVIQVENTLDESESLTQIEKEGFVTSNSKIVSRDSDENKFENTTAHNNDDTTMNDIGQTDLNMRTETTQPMLESTKISNINKKEKPLSDNLIKPSEKLPTAEALQESANPNVVNGSPQELTTFTDEIEITTESAEATTENSTNRRNSAINIKLQNSEMFALLYITVIAIF